MKKRFDVSGMTCAACQSHVDKAVKGINGVCSVNVNLLKNSMDVEYDESITNDNEIIKAVDNAGYKASLPNVKKDVESKDNSLRDLIISFVFLMILMYFSMGHMMWGWPAPKPFNMEYTKIGFALIQLLLVLPIMFIQRKYFVNGYKRLYKGPNMDSLIAIGATASFLYSIYCMFAIALDPADPHMYHMSLYFEACGMILVFVSIGKYLEGLSKRKTTASLERLMDLAPKTARLLKDNEEVIVSIDEVKIGDILIVKNGDIVPVDGVIIEGSASFDQSNITGESIPVYKAIDDSVYSSTILSSGYVKIKAIKIGEDTTYASIIRLVDEASNSKAPISKLADKISGIFVPTILSISVVVFIANLLFIIFAKPDYVTTTAFETALNYAITVVVIACPCALGLATPVAIMVSTGKGAENGLLIRNADILERTHKIKTVVLDKTGTITYGHPVVTDYIKYDNVDDALYSLESKSEHPLAKSIIDYFKDKAKPLEVANFNAIEGKGITGIIGNDEYYIGNAVGADLGIDDKLDLLSKEGKTPLVVLKNKKLAAIIACKDEIKPSSKEAIAELKNAGISVVMLTGDNEVTANAIAKDAGIDRVIANVLPGGKKDIIESLKVNDKELVAMVGDGVNDAPALMASDLGIAIGSGSDVAKENADIVLVRNDLMDVINVVSLSRRTINTIKLGLFWAFFYNLICVALATGLFYHLSKGSFVMKPEYGSIAMSISSVSVVLNALTIRLFKAKKSTNEDIIKPVTAKEENNMEKLVLNVSGMMCMHCVAHVEKACKKVEGVLDAKASLDDNTVTVFYEGIINKDAVVANIVDAGYEVK